MKIKQLSTGERVAIFALSEADDSEVVQVRAWLEERFPSEYQMDNLHITITKEAGFMFALRWLG